MTAEHKLRVLPEVSLVVEMCWRHEVLGIIGRLWNALERCRQHGWVGFDTPTHPSPSPRPSPPAFLPPSLAMLSRIYLSSLDGELGRHPVECVQCPLFSSDLCLYPTSLLQEMRQHREVQQLAQGHTATWAEF